ncbi:MAG: glycine zipper 2TM domain-containing protein [Sulfurospirillaceae bacterium]|nr:glycine zipper 2TM domain-containing protein [Sulfurospirillaceae bacterium]
MKKILLAIGLIFSLSQADSFHENRYVTYQPHRVVTKTVYRSNNRDNQVVGALIGGVVGGILGHQLGGGSGKVVATVGGAVIGTVVGSNLSHGKEYKRRIVHYEPRHRWNRVVYYTPRHGWKRVAYVNRNRFHEVERVMIYRDYR